MERSELKKRICRHCGRKYIEVGKYGDVAVSLPLQCSRCAQAMTAFLGNKSDDWLKIKRFK